MSRVASAPPVPPRVTHHHAPGRPPRTTSVIRAGSSERPHQVWLGGDRLTLVDQLPRMSWLDRVVFLGTADLPGVWQFGSVAGVPGGVDLTVAAEGDASRRVTVFVPAAPTRVPPPALPPEPTAPPADAALTDAPTTGDSGLPARREPKAYGLTFPRSATCDCCGADIRADGFFDVPSLVTPDEPGRRTSYVRCFSCETDYVVSTGGGVTTVFVADKQVNAEIARLVDARRNVRRYESDRPGAVIDDTPAHPDRFDTYA